MARPAILPSFHNSPSNGNSMRYRIWLALLFCLLSLPAFAAEGLQAELRFLDGLRKGFETDLTEVDRIGKELLEKYDAKADQAQIYFMLCHVHSQSGMRTPEQILKYAEAALETKLIRPDQRATMYSYMASAYEVSKEPKEFEKRRAKAIAPLLTGLNEMQAFELPEVQPEFVAGERPLIGDFADPAAAERARLAREAYARRRAEYERTRELVFRRNVLRQQVKDLYSRDPQADDELRDLATKAIDKETAEALMKIVEAERERQKKE
jgi:hypothetical protein